MAGNLRVFPPNATPPQEVACLIFLEDHDGLSLNKGGYTLGFPMSVEIYQECEEIDAGNPTYSNGTFPPFLPKWYFHIEIICCEIITRENTNESSCEIHFPACHVSLPNDMDLKQSPKFWSHVENGWIKFIYSTMCRDRLIIDAYFNNVISKNSNDLHDLWNLTTQPSLATSNSRKNNG